MLVPARRMLRSSSNGSHENGDDLSHPSLSRRFYRELPSPPEWEMGDR
jgi:hypothetical protein